MYSCDTSNSDNSSSTEINEISSSQALSLFKPKLISEVENRFPQPSPDVTEFSFNFESIDEVGVEYKISGSYDVYLGGRHTTTYGFSGTVNKYTGQVDIDSIYG